jgi:hypothetical protein
MPLVSAAVGAQQPVLTGVRLHTCSIRFRPARVLRFGRPGRFEACPRLRVDADSGTGRPVWRGKQDTESVKNGKMCQAGRGGPPPPRGAPPPQR